MTYTQTTPRDEQFIAQESATTATPATAFGFGLPRFNTIDEMVKTLRPSEPVQCLHPDAIIRAARTFIEHFPGASLYAVKSNPDPYVLQHLYAAGIRHFDVASLGEVKLARGLFPDAHLAYMNPVKSREAIREAYFTYGVRDFVIDTFEEMHKILEETNSAADLTIVVRLAMPKGSAACQLAGKFGCAPDAAVALLQAADKAAHRVGLSFHVGSQTLEPQSYATAIQKAGEVVRAAGVALDVFDVGGGFPVQHLGMAIPPLTDFFAVIGHEIAALQLPETCEIWSEPGRALSSGASTLIVRVELRKGDVLYINDGSYGNLFEVFSMNWKNTVQLLRPARKGRKTASKTLLPFRFYGPTCDSIDYMPGPFMLPEDSCEGDWIAIEGMGAYGAASQSHFNGFYSSRQVEIAPAAQTPARQRKSATASLRLVAATESAGK